MAGKTPVSNIIIDKTVTPPIIVNSTLTSVRSSANASGVSVAIEPAQHLIQHVKQKDPMLYEFLRRIQSTVVSAFNNGNVNAAPPQPPKAGPFHRTLLIKDTTVGNDIADRVPAQFAGTIYRVLMVLRKAISANLVVRVNKNGTALTTVTMPSATVIGTTVSIPVTQPVSDEDVFSWDITASDGSSDSDGVCSVTVEWQ